MHVRPALLLLCFICLTGSGRLRAQDSPAVSLHFVPVIGGRPLVLYDDANSLSKDSLRITTLRCYISGIGLWRDGKSVWEEPQSYHLLDASIPGSLRLRLILPAGLKYTTLRFNLGIDSTASASGAHGGELDPARGMYWAWQSGYINFKLEGISPRCNTRKHEFHFHIGGYQYPYAAIRQVSLEVSPTADLAVIMELKNFLTGIDLSTQNSVMIPGREAAELSERAASIFHAQQ